MTIEYYTVADTVVRQGDLVRLAPSLRALKSCQYVGPKETSERGTKARILDAASVSKDIASGKQDGTLIVPSRLSMGVLLTRGCDVDHDKMRQIAVIRPFSDLQGVDSKAGVIEGKFTSLHYLPRATLNGTELFDECFIDFRYIITVHKDLFAGLTRVCGLTRDALLEVYLSWFRHTSGRMIPKEKPCGKCGEVMPVFQLMESEFTPADDY